MLKFRIEKLKDCKQEIKKLFEANWFDTGLNHDRIKLDIDWDLYHSLDLLGYLQILTVRSDSALVGYYISVVRPHPHYKGTLFSLVDTYFLHPNYRGGTAGLGLFKAYEEAMKDLGVQMMITTSKHHKDVGKILEREGWSPVATQYTKWIGAK